MFRQQFGVELSRKTMGCWVEQAAELLKPLSVSSWNFALVNREHIGSRTENELNRHNYEI